MGGDLADGAPVLARAPARDTAIWSSYLGTLLGILAVARLRAPLLTGRTAIALLLGSLLLAALPFVSISLRPQGEMRLAWWNILISGGVLVILSSVGLVRVLRANVHGSRRVFDAVIRAEVPALVYASSVGAYSPAPKDRPVDETWPTDGWPLAGYGREKA